MSVLRIGNNQVNNLYVGNNPVQRIYRGSQQVFPLHIPTPGEGRFRVYANLSTRAGGEILEGDTIDVVEHQGLTVYMDDLSGWSDNDPRAGWNEIDFGERYSSSFVSGANLLPGQQFLRGTQLGYYPGPNAGHCFRGTNMQGVASLSAQSPTRTQTVRVFRTDGQQSYSLTFNVRVVRQVDFYTDISKQTYGMNYPETIRRGIIYVSRDTDFTGAEPAGPHIYHHTLTNGEYSRNTFAGDQSANGGPVYPWGSNDLTGMAILFKGGQEFYQTNQITPPGRSVTWGSWGGALATIDLNRLQAWDTGVEMFKRNGSDDARIIIHGLHVQGSYDPSLPEVREWWNILPYTNKTGTFGLNDLVTNGAGVYTRVVHDTGSELWTRQIVNTEDINLVTNNVTSFSNSDTLTSATGGICTFVSLNARQDRTKRWPPNFFTSVNANSSVDQCRIIGCDYGILAFGRGSVVCDTEIHKCFNYAFTLFNLPAGVSSWAAASGVLMTQPVSYYSEPVRTANSLSATNRSTWNTGSSFFDTWVVENRIRHAAHRGAKPGILSFHYCGVHWYGGHGLSPQQLFRMSTSSTGTDNDMRVVMFGCALAGGNNHIGWGSWSLEAVPRTPYYVLLDSNHFLATEAMGSNAFTGINHNSVSIRNNLFEAPQGVTLRGTNSDFTFISFDWELIPGADENWRPSFVEFNTFIFQSSGRETLAVSAEDTTLRDLIDAVFWRNNAYIIDPTRVTGIEEGRLALNENPTNFASDWRPLPGAIAYQSASAPIIRFDAVGTERSISNPSRGAIEPA